ncbi:MAG: hypothetical protein ACON5F_11695 [Jejuia sp.]
MNTLETIQQKINQAKELDFGTIFSEAFELFKKTWLQGFLLHLFSIVVMLPLILLFYVPFIGMIIAQQESGYNDPDVFNEFFAGMSIVYILFLIVGGFVLATVTYALTASYFRMVKKIDHGEEVKTSEFFHFLKAPYLKKIFLIMLVAILIAIPSALLCYIPLIYVIVPMTFFFIFFAYNPELSVGDIIKASFALGNKKWLITFGLLFVIYLIVLVLTMVTCGIGQLFVQSLLFHPAYLIYKHIIGFNEKSDIDQIGAGEI